MPKRATRDIVDRLLRVLTSAKEPLTTREVAKRSGVEWKTAHKFLDLLSGFSSTGTLTSTRRGASVFWKLETPRPRTRRGTPENLRRFTEWTEFVLSLKDNARKVGDEVGQK